MTSNVECIWPVGAELGEGALWSPGERAVWFVDILGCRLHRTVPGTDQRSSWHAPARPGFVVRLAGGGMLAGLADGLYRFDPERGSFTLLSPVDVGTDNRLNDGTVGPDGCLWFCSKNEPETSASGRWYRWTGKGEPVSFDGGYVVANGPAFSPDGRTAYHCDTAAGRILCRSVTRAGEVGANREFATVDAADGYPDGLAVDAEGCLWVALYAGSGVRRYSPDGALLEEIGLPCRNVTKPAFGGEDGRTLYLTTARSELPDEEPRAPLAGGLFAVRTEVCGAPAPAMTMPAPA